MNRDEIIARLRENEAALRQRGVAHAALFGSRARGAQRPDSDTDIMIEFDPAARLHGTWRAFVSHEDRGAKLPEDARVLHGRTGKPAGHQGGKFRALRPPQETLAPNP